MATLPAAPQDVGHPVIGMDTSTENAVFYICVGAVFMTLIICATVLIALGKLPPPKWWKR